jgi:Reverse transcriptase (RNA-dependent DNA polymerase)
VDPNPENSYQPYEPPISVRRSQRQRFSTRDPNFAYAAALNQKDNIQLPHTEVFASAMAALHASKNRMKKFTPIAHDYVNAVASIFDATNISGADPNFFLPEPRNLKEVLCLPKRYRDPWFAAFYKEITGLLDQETFEIETPPLSTPITPVMEVYKCKLDPNGRVDKLKDRIVFRGDLYTPTEPENTWNPFARYLAFLMFIALCAVKRMFPSQSDLVQAYLQCFMRECVYVMLPAFWAEYLPDKYKKYCGVPLRCKRALYGYPYSGKRLYEDQQSFLIGQGLKQSSIQGIWYRHLPNDGFLLILLFADDILSACTDDKVHTEFRTALQARFKIQTQPRANWYLQAQILQDEKGNITIDQT